MALVAHSLLWNFVKFADYTAIAECIEVSSAHKCMPILQTLILNALQNLLEELMVGLISCLMESHRDALGQKGKFR